MKEFMPEGSSTPDIAPSRPPAHEVSRPKSGRDEGGGGLGATNRELGKIAEQVSQRATAAPPPEASTQSLRGLGLLLEGGIAPPELQQLSANIPKPESVRRASNEDLANLGQANPEPEKPLGSNETDEAKSEAKNPPVGSTLEEIQQRLAGEGIEPGSLEGVQQAARDLSEAKTPNYQPTIEEITEVQEAVKTGKWKGFDVVDSFTHGGVPTIKVRLPSGELITHRAGAKEALGAGVVPDISAGLNEADLREEILGKIESYEDRENAPLLSRPVIEAFLHNIDNYIIPGIPRDNLVEIRRSITQEARARLFLASADYYATIGAAEQFAEAMNEWDLAGLKFIGHTMEHEGRMDVRVGDAVHALEQNSGVYYRSDSVARQAADIAIIGAIEANLMAAGIPDADRRARQSLELAKKIMKVTGQAAYFSGPADAANNLIEEQVINTVFPGGAGINMEDERYWEEWERRRRAGIVLLRADTTMQGMFKNTFFAPEVLQELNQGLAAGLRYATETRARCLTLYFGGTSLEGLIGRVSAPAPVGAPPGTPNGMQLLEAEGNLYRWGNIIKGGSDLSAQFHSKEPSLLNNPLNAPEQANKDPSKILDALKPYMQIAGYEYLRYYSKNMDASEMPADARKDLLSNLLQYMQTEEAHRVFEIYAWNSNQVSIATDFMKRIGKIDTRHVNEVNRENAPANSLFLLTLLAGLQNGNKEAREDLFKFALGLFKLIRYDEPGGL